MTFRSLPTLKCKTKHKGPLGMVSDSEEDPDGDVTGILGQRAARRAAAIQVMFFFSAKSLIDRAELGGHDAVEFTHCRVEFASIYIQEQQHCVNF